MFKFEIVLFPHQEFMHYSTNLKCSNQLVNISPGSEFFFFRFSYMIVEWLALITNQPNSKHSPEMIFLSFLSSPLRAPFHILNHFFDFGTFGIENHFWIFYLDLHAFQIQLSTSAFLSLDWVELNRSRLTWYINKFRLIYGNRVRISFHKIKFETLDSIHSITYRNFQTRRNDRKSRQKNKFFFSHRWK